MPFFSSNVGTFANKSVVPLLQEYDSDETMNVVQEEQKADQAARTSIVKVHYGTSTVLEEAVGLHWSLIMQLQDFHFRSLKNVL
jgi:hypothetical protein